MLEYLKKYGFICLSGLLLIILIVIAVYASDLSKDYYQLQKTFVKEKQNYVFLGDSLTDYYPLEEFYEDDYIVNSGISGNKTQDILDNLDKRVYRYNPTKVFLLIGINDMASDIDNKSIIKNIQKIVDKIAHKRPYTKIYIESIYPLGKERSSKKFHNIDNRDITKLNQNIKYMCERKHLNYINVYDTLLDNQGYLKDKYSDDGVHLNGLGYYKVTKILKKYVKEKQ